MYHVLVDLSKRDFLGFWFYIGMSRECFYRWEEMMMMMMMKVERRFQETGGS